jgi:predicted regulator of amino acid metabolism with ACT domain
MWSAIKKYFSNYPAQEKVAKLLLRYGLSVKRGGIYCEDIEIPAFRISRALGIDRRVVNTTIDTISTIKELREFFEELRPIPFFRDIAKIRSWGVVEIVPEDPSMPGILAKVSKIIAEADISIRQAITEDPEFSDEATLTIICEREIPANLIPKIRNIKGVTKVVIY